MELNKELNMDQLMAIYNVLAVEGGWLAAPTKRVFANKDLAIASITPLLPDEETDVQQYLDRAPPLPERPERSRRAAKEPKADIRNEIGLRGNSIRAEAWNIWREAGSITRNALASQIYANGNDESYRTSTTQMLSSLKTAAETHGFTIEKEKNEEGEWVYSIVGEPSVSEASGQMDIEGEGAPV